MNLQEAKALCKLAHRGQYRRKRPLTDEEVEIYYTNLEGLSIGNTTNTALGRITRTIDWFKVEEHYFNHPIGVADMLEDESEKKVAYLHDIIEDTEAELYQDIYGWYIKFEGNHTDYSITKLEWHALRLLTKLKGQSYDSYLREVAESTIATNVKIADMIYNLCDNPTEKQKIKYKKGIMCLLSTK